MATVRMFSEDCELSAVIHPDLHQGTYYTPWVYAGDFHRMFAELQVGDIGQGGTIDMELQEAQDAAGTGGAAIATKAITQLTQAGGDGDDVCLIECEMVEMTDGYSYVRVRLDALTASANCSVTLRGWRPRFSPVTNNYTEVISG